MYESLFMSVLPHHPEQRHGDGGDPGGVIYISGRPPAQNVQAGQENYIQLRSPQLFFSAQNFQNYAEL